MNYIQKVRDILKSKINVEEDLLDLYVLLVLINGKSVELSDVHDAWATWKNNIDPKHKSLIPFEELAPEVQELDREYAVAIRDTATLLARENLHAVERDELGF